MADVKGVDVKSEFQIVNVRSRFLRSKRATPLSLSEQRILMYAIYKFQRNSHVQFLKSELEEFYGINFGAYNKIHNYIEHLTHYGMDLNDEANERFIFVNAFEYISYSKGLFKFKFTETYFPQIQLQKERFLQLGLSGFKQFQSVYTLYLYEYLKDNLWGPITKKENIDLETFRSIFYLKDSEYSNNNANFKLRCWGVAMREINEKTAYKIEIVSKGRGKHIQYNIRRIIDENFKKLNNASKFECKFGKPTITEQCSKCLYINRCNNKLDYAGSTTVGECFDVIRDITLKCPNYSLEARVKEGVCDEAEEKYWQYIALGIVDDFDRQLLFEEKAKEVDDLQNLNQIYTLLDSKDEDYFKASKESPDQLKLFDDDLIKD